MIYKILLTKEFEKDFRKLNSDMQLRIKKKCLKDINIFILLLIVIVE